MCAATWTNSPTSQRRPWSSSSYDAFTGRPTRSSRPAGLVDHDTRHGTALLTTLRLCLDAAGNRTTAARQGGLSRETVYQRLRSIERLLDCDLESGERRTERHVVLTALDVLRDSGERPTRGSRGVRAAGWGRWPWCRRH
ncbi:helix-turn-helix domain-containing protein [Streptomyces sp. Qhu-G9]|uniref:helix-turn-helix domain-containing protein n=1 Tax=Streptomyces sp. Qhu-G9 TaxID=3452799 RepID=UPI003AF6318A